MEHNTTSTNTPSGFNRWMTPLGSDSLNPSRHSMSAHDNAPSPRYTPNELLPNEVQAPARPLQPVFPDWEKQPQAPIAQAYQQPQILAFVQQAAPAPMAQTSQQPQAPELQAYQQQIEKLDAPTQARRRSRVVERETVPPDAFAPQAETAPLPVAYVAQAAPPPAPDAPLPEEESPPAMEPAPDDMDVGEGEDDAMPNDAMAVPATVPVGVITLPQEKKKHAWPWVTLAVLVLLAAATLALWKTGALSALLGRELPKAPDFIPAIFGAVQSQDNDGQDATAADSGIPRVDSLSADVLNAHAPATITFRVHANLAVTDVKLLTASGSAPQVTSVESSVATDGVQWVIKLFFEEPYNDVIRVYMRDAAGEWHNGSLGCMLEIV